MKKENMMRSAIAGVLALGTLAAAGHAIAADMKKPTIPPMPKGWEACGGITKAGMNDCGVRTSLHSCAGLAKKDGEADSYIYLPKGQCDRIVGGKVLTVTEADAQSLTPQLLSPGEFALLGAFSAGQRLANACTVALEAEPGFDPPDGLKRFVVRKIVVDFSG